MFFQQMVSMKFKRRVGKSLKKWNGMSGDMKNEIDKKVLNFLEKVTKNIMIYL